MIFPGDVDLDQSDRLNRFVFTPRKLTNPCPVYALGAGAAARAVNSQVGKRIEPNDPPPLPRPTPTRRAALLHFHSGFALRLWRLVDAEALHVWGPFHIEQRHRIIRR